MISMDAAFGVAFMCIVLGAFSLLLCYCETTSRKSKIFWWVWLAVWATPLLVPVYITLWLGA